MSITKKDETFIRNFLALRDEFAQLKAAYEEAEASLKALLEQVEDHTVNIDGHTLTLVESKRRSFDVEALRELVSASVFKKVTEPTVKTTLFDAAVKLGNIDTEIIEQVVSVTPYTQLRVK